MLERFPTLLRAGLRVVRGANGSAANARARIKAEVVEIPDEESPAYIQGE